jgi:hypothetical protein
VIDVQGDLASVESFTVLTEDGPVVYLPDVEITAPFPLPHLRDHILSGEPVVVLWEIREGVEVAVSVDDA